MLYPYLTQTHDITRINLRNIHEWLSISYQWQPPACFTRRSLVLNYLLMVDSLLNHLLLARTHSSKWDQFCKGNVRAILHLPTTSIYQPCRLANHTFSIHRDCWWCDVNGHETSLLINTPWLAEWEIDSLLATLVAYLAHDFPYFLLPPSLLVYSGSPLTKGDPTSLSLSPSLLCLILANTQYQ